MSIDFDEAYEVWMHSLLEKETNPRVRSRIENGLEYGTLEFLRSVWFPIMKNFNHLQPEWEVRDFHNGYRYLDLAYLPGNGVKGGIEIQGYGPQMCPHPLIGWKPRLFVMPDASSVLLPRRNLLRICELQISTLEEFLIKLLRRGLPSYRENKKRPPYTQEVFHLCPF